MSIETLTYSDQSDAALKAKITELEDEITLLQLAAGSHRADFERERDRAERLMTELLKATGDLMRTKETAARLEGELAALRPRSKRLAS